MNILLTFVVTLGAISAFCYILMAKPDRRRARRNSDSDASGTDSGVSSGTSGFAGWFGHSGTDAMGNPIDGGGSDSDSGGDSVGGGDGGGGD